MRYRDTIRQLEKDLQIIEEKYSIEEKKLSKKQMKIANAAPPEDEITGADFKALKKAKNKNENYEESEFNEGDYEINEKRKKRKSGKLTRGYKANRSKADQKRLSDLTQQYKDAKKTKGKADDLAAIKARDAFEKTQTNTGKKSKYNYAETLNNLSEDDQRMVISELMDEAANELLEKKQISKKVHDALKKKAKDRNAPLGALKTIYRKGMGAFYSSGSRSGQNPHSWAMARVNSVLKGGKARKVDAAQWKQIQKHRKKKRKK